MELRWQVNFDVSAMHAAWAVASGRQLIDTDLYAELAPAVAQLGRFSDEVNTPATVFWRRLVTLSAEFPSNEQLAQRLLARLQPDALSPQNVSRLSAAISSCEAIIRRRFPNMLQELNLRRDPLQLAWEARGPGLLFMLSETIGKELIAESASVLLVQPVVGGDGMAHISTNRVHIEALLTDADHRLPETLRLAWLLGQLNLDLPATSDGVHGHSLDEVAELALLPPILAAAENLQLAQLEPATLQLALSLWLRTSDERLEPLANILSAWWETVSEAQWPWSTALAALSKMLNTNATR